MATAPIACSRRHTLTRTYDGLLGMFGMRRIQRGLARSPMGSLWSWPLELCARTADIDHLACGWRSTARARTTTILVGLQRSLRNDTVVTSFACGPFVAGPLTIAFRRSSNRQRRSEPMTAYHVSA